MMIKMITSGEWVVWLNPQETVDLVRFAEKSLIDNYIFCAVICQALATFCFNSVPISFHWTQK